MDSQGVCELHMPLAQGLCLSMVLIGRSTTHRYSEQIKVSKSGLV
jgi:hypothetical protein